MGVTPVSQSAPPKIESAVPDVVAPPPGNPRFPMFDGLRALAALAILVNHAVFIAGYNMQGTLRQWTSLLDIGVPVFFVVSGFLLYRPYVSADMRGVASTPLATFIRRRALRIIPAYWVALTLISLYPYNAQTFEHWPRFYFFLQAYFPPSSGGLAQAWSLCVEVAFYLVLPFYAAVMSRIHRKTGPLGRFRMDVLALLLLSGFSLFTEISVVSNSHAGSSAAWDNSLVRYFFWFALGMLMALSSSWQSDSGKATKNWFQTFVREHPTAIWALAATAFLIAGALNTTSPLGFRAGVREEIVYWLLGGVTAALLVLPAAFAEVGRGVPGSVLGSRLLSWLGLVSYGIFLWNLAPLNYFWSRTDFGVDTHSARAVINVGVALAFTIPVAAASYYIVERPFLKLKFRKKTDQLTLSS